MAEIEQAVLTKDSQLLKRVMHTLKSSAANVGAETLSGLCKQLEQYGRENQIDKAGELLEETWHEYDQVIVALQKLLREI